MTRPPLACRTWGAPANPPLLLLHGFLGGGEDWADVAAALADDFYCVAPDLPGHGRTPFDPAAHGTFGRYARSVLTVTDSLHLESVAAIGYSMGGRILLALAIAKPRVVSRMVLESTSPGIDDKAERVARWRADRELMERLRRDDPGAFLAWWYGQPLFGDIQSCAGYAAMLERRLRNEPGQVARALGAASPGRQISLWDRLSRVRSETLVVCGEADTKYRAIAARMRARCDRFAAVSVPACSHAVHVQQPRRFIELCKDFLVAPPARRRMET